jgi:hypothetical protein
MASFLGIELSKDTFRAHVRMEATGAYWEALALICTVSSTGSAWSIRLASRHSRRANYSAPRPTRSMLRSSLVSVKDKAPSRGPRRRPEPASRLLAAGIHKRLIIGAVMRKLLVLAYGILRSGVAFDVNYA